MPHGGVCHARKTIEPAATSSAGGSDDLASLAGVRSGVGTSTRLPESLANPTGRFDAGKYRKPDEHGSDFRFEERAEDVPGGGGDLCHNTGRHSSLWSDEYSRFAAHGAWDGRDANQCQHLGHLVCRLLLEKKKKNRLCLSFSNTAHRRHKPHTTLHLA